MSSAVIGEPFSALPAYQTVNRFVPLPSQVNHINTYQQCMTAMSDAAYYARNQAILRGNDPLRMQYANWFDRFAFHDNSSSMNVNQSPINEIYSNGEVVDTFPPGIGCQLLLNNRTSKTAWPVAKQQLEQVCLRFHSGLPLLLPEPFGVSDSSVQCTNTYNTFQDNPEKKWQCTLVNWN